jgi:hypothetical protein
VPPPRSWLVSRPGTEACLLRRRSCPGSAMQPGQRRVTANASKGGLRSVRAHSQGCSPDSFEFTSRPSRLTAKWGRRAQRSRAIRTKSSPGSAATHGADAARFDSSGSMRTSAAWASGGAFWSWRRGRHDAGIVSKWFSTLRASRPPLLSQTRVRDRRERSRLSSWASASTKGVAEKMSATVGIIRNQALADTGRCSW